MVAKYSTWIRQLRYVPIPACTNLTQEDLAFAIAALDTTVRRVRLHVSLVHRRRITHSTVQLKVKLTAPDDISHPAG